MRTTGALLLLLVAGSTWGQELPTGSARPLTITQAVAVPLSATQLMPAVREAWDYSFGQEPGARIVSEDPGAGMLEGVARFNFKAEAVGVRLASLGVINYRITIQTENGVCKVRIGQFEHVGNANAPEGPVSLGRIYAGGRPRERVPGVSRSVAQRLNDDMRTQVDTRLASVIGSFFSRLRRAAQLE